jgi:hypothetical protein
MQRALPVLGFFVIAILASAVVIGPEAIVMLGVMLFILAALLGFVAGKGG